MEKKHGGNYIVEQLKVILFYVIIYNESVAYLSEINMVIVEWATANGHY